MNQPISCPKCNQARLVIDFRPPRIAAACPSCQFHTPWLTVPAFQAPSYYLRVRMRRVAMAYRAVKGEQGVAA